MMSRAARSQSAALRWLLVAISVRYRMEMTIRYRTESKNAQHVATAVAVGGLGVAAAVHAAWARGSSWPAADSEQLADLVVGRRPFPSRRETWGVTVLLGAATAVTATRAGLLPFPGGWQARPIRWGSKVVASTLLIRGVGGFVVSGLGLVESTPRFRRWDLLMYSPLCLVLSAAAVLSRSDIST